ncbi:type II toxin-antitoxin system Phd/YefM family antitoxin [Flavobacterium coralii]|uniref:type II toxin-antitoxin system Phd/YefM family antitoxin n=1 Tax=Flavobacterium coralii TaxID=2838017 RepID=UPI000C6006CC|nr:type II toxin-antitoxin system prevent-host-death family antitoxin [Flavobacterium sp.]|tara:strand:- start:1135 stop:1362 length:228 start_codon:yes stop_codon:yes gene_type:complete
MANHCRLFFHGKNADHLPVMVTRQNGAPAIVMSVQGYNSYAETAYLMGSAKNAIRLNKAIADIEAGKAKAHRLAE